MSGHALPDGLEQGIDENAAMRRVALLVVVLGLTAAACAPDNPPASASTSEATTTIVTGERYPAEMVEAYMDGVPAWR